MQPIDVHKLLIVQAGAHFFVLITIVLKDTPVAIGMMLIKAAA
jgi:hypothetical protein